MPTLIYAPASAPAVYPYGLAQLRADNPNVSFSVNPTAEDLAPFDVFPVTPTDPPACDPRTERIEEVTPEQDGNAWHQSWTVRPATPEEIAAWDAANTPRPSFQAFYDSLLVSACYGAALQEVMTASTAAPAAALAVLISAIQDALNGRPNPPALQASIWLLLGQINLSQEHLAELQGLLVAAHLDGLVNLTPPTPGPQP